MTLPHPIEPRRGVTRGYVVGLIGAVTLVGCSLVIASWGGITYFTGLRPVETPGISAFAAMGIVLVAVLVLVWGLWLQALLLLRGRREPAWTHALVIAGGAYFIWCLGGILLGLSIAETWVSPFALAITLIWGLCSILFWALLARRVYTDRPPPQWPWERRGEAGPDWKTPEEMGE